MLKNVHIGERLAARGITENHRGFPLDKDIRVFGADTETCRGQIYTAQLSSEGEVAFLKVTPKDAFVSVMRWIERRVIDKGLNIVFFHNLRFDLTVLFAPQHQLIYDQYNDIHFDSCGYRIRMLYGRVNYVRIWKDLGNYICKQCGEVPDQGVKKIGGSFYCANPLHGSPTTVRRNLGPVVQWIDSAAFCPPGSKSLAAALKIYGVPYKKLKAPDGLGEKKLTGAAFEVYAKNDAIAEEALGRAILALHKEYDITPCVSLPQLSARILRHHFFKEGETFPFPPEPCRLAAELSYHAGKNGFYVKPGCYEDLYEYDINSAFPKAMREMPQMVRGSYVRVKTFRAGYLGIYRIAGRAKRSMRYPLVFNSAFRPCRTVFKNEWITGYEWELLKKDINYRAKIQEGWIWKHDKNYGHSPLREFVERFYTLKSTAPKGPKRDTYKNILNSLYGKFAACVEKRETLETGEGTITLGGDTKYFVAGALYHPFIATQITGYVRAELYRLETQGEALHAATDSIKSRADLPCSDELGGIKKETFGRCYLFRNKLYLHFAKDNSLCKHDLEKGWLYVSKADAALLDDVEDDLKTGKRWDGGQDRYYGKLFDGDQHLCKYGLHGFKGSVFELYCNRQSLFKDGYLDYSHPHMTNLREAIKRKEVPAMMVNRKERLLLCGAK